MNNLMLLVLGAVALCYCGGKYCPNVLKQNKEMLLGVFVGMALCSFADLRLEGLQVNSDCCTNGTLDAETGVTWNENFGRGISEVPGEGCMEYGPQREDGADGYEADPATWSAACGRYRNPPPTPPAPAAPPTPAVPAVPRAKIGSGPRRRLDEDDDIKLIRK